MDYSSSNLAIFYLFTVTKYTIVVIGRVATNIDLQIRTFEKLKFYDHYEHFLSFCDKVVEEFRRNFSQESSCVKSLIAWDY